MWAVEDLTIPSITVEEILEEDMSLRKEVSEAITEAVAKAFDAHRPRGWKKWFFYVRESGLLAVNITVIVALIAIVVTLIVAVSNRRDADAKFRSDTENTLTRVGERLTGIEGTLRTLQAVQYPKKILQELATLDKDAFAKNLPALRKVAEQSPKDLAISGGTLREVAQKLDSVDESTPGYWPTALQFLRFASAGNSSGVPPPGIPNLTIRQSRLSLGTVRDRIVLLDGGELENTRFEHSRIIFTNDPVKLNGVIFVDCVFEVPVTDNPSPFLKKASRQLLASNLQSVSPILP